MFAADVALERNNTLQLASSAEWLARPTTELEAADAIAEANVRGAPITILGGGSNVVLRARIPGCVVVPQIGGIQVQRGANGVMVTAGAGVGWHALVRYCLGRGIQGIENLALIPGSVGAAPIQNIGAYGLELRERFHSLTALSCRDGARVTMDARACEFAYRDSIFKRGSAADLLITAVTLCLPNRADLRIGYPDVERELASMGVAPDATHVAEAVIRVRRRKLPDPRRIPNVGSFFKNPILGADALDRLQRKLGGVPTYPDGNGTKIAAARLVDAAGWKGRRLGRVGVWPRQPLVLVNLGGATSRDVLRLAESIRDDVAARFDVQLEFEPIVLGIEA